MAENWNDLDERSRMYWSWRAEDFSQLRMQEYRSPARSELLNLIRQSMPEQEGPVRALDAGCGAGLFSMLLKEAGCTVTAVDFSLKMLEKAEANCRENGFTDILFREMDIRQLQLETGSFDYVLSRNVIWTVQHADEAYREMYRVLRPGGILMNLDANYGAAFLESDRKGIPPSHPTQTPEQLRLRNQIASEMEVSFLERPAWDFALLWECGAEEIRCIRNIGVQEEKGGEKDRDRRRAAEMFAVIARKA